MTSSKQHSERLHSVALLFHVNLTTPERDLESYCSLLYFRAFMVEDDNVFWAMHFKQFMPAKNSTMLGCGAFLSTVAPCVLYIQSLT